MPAEDPGDPIAYLALDPGTPVYAQDGTPVGSVQRVLADQRQDVFDGIVISSERGDRFADAEQIDTIYERAVTLKLSRGQSETLPQPTANSTVLGEDPRESVRPPAGGLPGFNSSYRSWLRDLGRWARDRLNRPS